MRYFIIFFAIFSLSSFLQLEYPDNANISVIAEKLEKDVIYTSKKSNQYFQPYSCTKIISGLYFLDYLGENFTFKTDLFKTSDQNYLLKFGGDYTLDSDKLSKFFESLKNKKIPGELILDASLFQNDEFSPNIMLADKDSSYYMPISAAVIDRNLETVFISVNSDTGDISYKYDGPEKVKFDIKFSKNNYFFAKRTRNSIIFHGEMKKKLKDYPKKIGTLDIEKFIIRKIKNILKKHNINFKKGIRFERNNKKYNILETIYSHKSDKLDNLLKTAFRKSDNLAFDSLYSIVLNREHSNPDWHFLYKQLKNYYRKKHHIDLEKSYIIDGSGTSPYNIIKPSIMQKITKAAYVDNRFKKYFPNIEANEGLFNLRNFKKNIYAKTGSASGKSCLSGYIKNKDGDVIFTILSNSFAPQDINIKQIEEKIANSISDK